MTIHLSKALERFVHDDAVRAGLYSSEDAVIRDLRFQRLGQQFRVARSFVNL
jgi:Arc/MetJ-type ribon-helix-helix transcriptional regulator